MTLDVEINVSFLATWACVTLVMQTISKRTGTCLIDVDDGLVNCAQRSGLCAVAGTICKALEKNGRPLCKTHVVHSPDHCCFAHSSPSLPRCWLEVFGSSVRYRLASSSSQTLYPKSKQRWIVYVVFPCLLYNLSHTVLFSPQSETSPLHSSQDKTEYTLELVRTNEAIAHLRLSKVV